jgi:hypothetical protein
MTQFRYTHINNLNKIKYKYRNITHYDNTHTETRNKIYLSQLPGATTRALVV